MSKEEDLSSYILKYSLIPCSAKLILSDLHSLVSDLQVQVLEVVRPTRIFGPV